MAGNPGSSSGDPHKMSAEVEHTHQFATPSTSYVYIQGNVHPRQLMNVQPIMYRLPTTLTQNVCKSENNSCLRGNERNQADLASQPQAFFIQSNPTTSTSGLASNSAENLEQKNVQSISLYKNAPGMKRKLETYPHKNLYETTKSKCNRERDYLSGYTSDESEDGAFLNKRCKIRTLNKPMKSHGKTFNQGEISYSGGRPLLGNPSRQDSANRQNQYINHFKRDPDDIETATETESEPIWERKKLQLDVRERQIFEAEELIRQQEEKAQECLMKALQQKENALNNREDSLRKREAAAQKKLEQAMKMLRQSGKAVEANHIFQSTKGIFGLAQTSCQVQSRRSSYTSQPDSDSHDNVNTNIHCNTPIYSDELIKIKEHSTSDSNLSIPYRPENMDVSTKSNLLEKGNTPNLELSKVVRTYTRTNRSRTSSERSGSSPMAVKMEAAAPMQARSTTPTTKGPFPYPTSSNEETVMNGGTSVTIIPVGAGCRQLSEPLSATPKLEGFRALDRIESEHSSSSSNQKFTSGKYFQNVEETISSTSLNALPAKVLSRRLSAPAGKLVSNQNYYSGKIKSEIFHQVLPVQDYAIFDKRDLIGTPDSMSHNILSRSDQDYSAKILEGSDKRLKKPNLTMQTLPVISITSNDVKSSASCKNEREHALPASSGNKKVTNQSLAHKDLIEQGKSIDTDSFPDVDVIVRIGNTQDQPEFHNRQQLSPVSSRFEDKKNVTAITESNETLFPGDIFYMPVNKHGPLEDGTIQKKSTPSPAYFSTSHLLNQTLPTQPVVSDYKFTNILQQRLLAPLTSLSSLSPSSTSVVDSLSNPVVAVQPTTEQSFKSIPDLQMLTRIDDKFIPNPSTSNISVTSVYQTADTTSQSSGPFSFPLKYQDPASQQIKYSASPQVTVDSNIASQLSQISVDNVQKGVKTSQDNCKVNITQLPGNVPHISEVSQPSERVEVQEYDRESNNQWISSRENMPSSEDFTNLGEYDPVSQTLTTSHPIFLQSLKKSKCQSLPKDLSNSFADPTHDYSLHRKRKDVINQTNVQIQTENETPDIECSNHIVPIEDHTQQNMGGEDSERTAFPTNVSSDRKVSSCEESSTTDVEILPNPSFQRIRKKYLKANKNVTLDSEPVSQVPPDAEISNENYSTSQLYAGSSDGNRNISESDSSMSRAGEDGFFISTGLLEPSDLTKSSTSHHDSYVHKTEKHLQKSDDYSHNPESRSCEDGYIQNIEPNMHEDSCVHNMESRSLTNEYVDDAESHQHDSYVPNSETQSPVSVTRSHSHADNVQKSQSPNDCYVEEPDSYTNDIENYSDSDNEHPIEIEKMDLSIGSQATENVSQLEDNFSEDSDARNSCKSNQEKANRILPEVIDNIVTNSSSFQQSITFENISKVTRTELELLDKSGTSVIGSGYPNKVSEKLAPKDLEKEPTKISEFDLLLDGNSADTGKSFQKTNMDELIRQDEPDVGSKRIEAPVTKSPSGRKRGRPRKDLVKESNTTSEVDLLLDSNFIIDGQSNLDKSIGQDEYNMSSKRIETPVITSPRTRKRGRLPKNNLEKERSEATSEFDLSVGSNSVIEEQTLLKSNIDDNLVGEDENNVGSQRIESPVITSPRGRRRGRPSQKDLEKEPNKTSELGSLVDSSVTDEQSPQKSNTNGNLTGQDEYDRDLEKIETPVDMSSRGRKRGRPKGRGRPRGRSNLAATRKAISDDNAENAVILHSNVDNESAAKENLVMDLSSIDPQESKCNSSWEETTGIADDISDDENPNAKKMEHVSLSGRKLKLRSYLSKVVSHRRRRSCSTSALQSEGKINEIKDQDVASSEDSEVDERNRKRKYKKSSAMQNKGKRNIKPKKTKYESVKSKKSKSSNENPSPKTDVKCGKCKVVSPNAQQFMSHSRYAHNGLARPEGESQEFSDKEMTKILIATIKHIKKLKCEICTKPFKSYLGYLYHAKICGKNVEDVSTTTCPECSQSVISHYLKTHLRLYHNKRVRKNKSKIPQMDELDGPRPKRQAASQCNDKLKVFQDELKPNIMDDNEKDNPKTLRKMYVKCAHIPPEVLRKWTLDIESKGKTACPNTNCTYSFIIMKRGQMHYNNCPHSTIAKKLKCKVCKCIIESELEMIDHVSNTHANVTHKFKKKSISFKIGPDDVFEPNLDCSDNDADFGPNCSDLDTKSPRRFVKMANRLKPFENAIDLTIDFMFENYSHNLFPNWVVSSEDCILLKEEERQPFLPSVIVSPRFKVNTISIEETSISSDWLQLQQFNGTSVSKGCAFFCGGPIMASAWCPQALEDSLTAESQYLALCTASLPDQKYYVGKSYHHEGLIQIWKCSNPIQLENYCPSFEYGVSHHFGNVWSLAWCPSGIYSSKEFNNPINKKNLQRIGLLAVAFSEGTIRIFVVPHPRVFESVGDPKILKIEPKVTLESSSMFNRDAQCLQVDWFRGKGHESIAGAFSTGFVCVWDLNTTSCLLRVQGPVGLILYPINCFLAHNGVCSTVSFCPTTDGRNIVTGGNDRTYKFWDLENTSMPLSIHRKGLITDTVWLSHWAGSFVSFDDVYGLGATNSCFRENGFFGIQPVNVLSANSAVFTLSASPWFNTVVHGDSAGEVVMSVQHQLFNNYQNEKGPSRRKVPLMKVHIEKFDEGKALSFRMKNNITEESSDDKSPKKIKQKEKEGNENDISEKGHHLNSGGTLYLDLPKTYSETTDSYGVVFTDQDHVSFTNIPEEQAEERRRCEKMEPGPLGCYPMICATSLSWNENVSANTLMFIGTQSGLCRVINMQSLRTKDCLKIVKNKIRNRKR